jgi:hypothetical protein
VNRPGERERTLAGRSGSLWITMLKKSLAPCHDAHRRDVKGTCGWPRAICSSMPTTVACKMAANNFKSFLSLSPFLLNHIQIHTHIPSLLHATVESERLQRDPSSPAGPLFSRRSAVHVSQLRGRLAARRFPWAGT